MLGIRITKYFRTIKIRDEKREEMNTQYYGRNYFFTLTPREQNTLCCVSLFFDGMISFTANAFNLQWSDFTISSIPFIAFSTLCRKLEWKHRRLWATMFDFHLKWLFTMFIFVAITTFDCLTLHFSHFRRLLSNLTSFSNLCE